MNFGIDSYVERIAEFISARKWGLLVLVIVAPILFIGINHYFSGRDFFFDFGDYAEIASEMLVFGGIVIYLSRIIASRTRLIQEIKASEERYRNLADISPDGIIVGVDKRCVYANDAAAELVGLKSSEELIGKGPLSVIHPESWESVKERMRIVQEDGKPVPWAEERYVQPDGTIVHAEVSAAPVLFHGEQGILAVFRDITDRKMAEDALRASEEKYKLLVEKAHEGIFVVRDTAILYINQAVEEILGFTPAQVLGKSFVEFAHPDDRETVVGRHYRRLKGETFPSRYTIRIIGGQDRVKWADIDSMLIDWEGKPAVMVFLTDITHRKLAEETAVETARLRAIADLSAGVAHHFNNLLQIIVGSASLCLLELESGGDPNQVKTTLERMLEASRLGAETVRRLQSFADIRADITREEAAIFDIAGTARNAAEISKPLWKTEPEKRGSKVNLQLDLEEGCVVQGKENEIFEALVNLIKNSAEAMPQRGDLEVRVAREADEVVIKVSDTGIGIVEKDLTRIFEPFWSTKGVGIGKGMGLAVTHEVVKRHGGTISVESKAGEGTTFTVRLPSAHQLVTKTAQQSMKMSLSEAHLRILVIEDEEHVATLLESVLAKAGHRVFKALSGEEGLAVFHRETVDMVICDLGMPGMSGWDVGTAIRSMCGDRGILKPAFVMLTGWGGQELEEEKIAVSGTDAVVAKPIDSAALLAIVQEMVSHGRG